MLLLFTIARNDKKGLNFKPLGLDSSNRVIVNDCKD